MDLNGKSLNVFGGTDTTTFLKETSLIQLSGNASLTITSTAGEKGTLTYQNGVGISGFYGKTSAVTMTDNAALNVNNANITALKGNTLALAAGAPNLTVGKGASITSMASMAIAAYSDCTGGSITIKDAAEVGKPNDAGTFHQTTIERSGYGALKLYSSNVGLDITDGVLYGSVDVYSETQKNAFSAASGKAIIINGTKRTDNNFWTENAAYSQKGILVTGQYLLTPNVEDVMTPSKIVIVTPYTISKASVTVNTPVGGKKQDKTTAVIPTADTGKYTASVTGWYNSDGTAVADDETFTTDRQYTVHVVIEANPGFSLEDNLIANINGNAAITESTDKTGKKLIKYTFTAAKPATENIYAAAVTVKEPAADEVLVPQYHNAVSVESDKYTVDLTSWYEGENTTETIIPVNGTTAFKAGKKYTISVKLLPAEGKKFVFNGTTVKINGNNAGITNLPPDGTVVFAYYTFTVAPPITPPEIMTAKITVNEPIGGNQLLTYTHDAVPAEPYIYTVDQTIWYEGEGTLGTIIPANGTYSFETGKKYTISVKLLPTEGKKFVSGTTVKINGNNATITTLPPDGTVVFAYYTFVALPGGIKMTFDPNGGTGTQTPVYADKNGEIYFPECTFTKSGDEFFAWKVNGELKTADPKREVPYKITENTTAAAVWKSNVTSDVKITMEAITAGKLPADIGFSVPVNSKYRIDKADWYVGDIVDPRQKTITTPLSADKNYTVQITLSSSGFLSEDELKVTLNSKTITAFKRQSMQHLVVTVQILNNVSLDFWEPMDELPLASPGDMTVNSNRFFVSLARWYKDPNRRIQDMLTDGAEAECGKPYYLTLTLRSDKENQIFGGDKIKANGKEYPITDRNAQDNVDFIISKLEFTATYPQVRISEDSEKGYIYINSPKAINVTFAAARYDLSGRMDNVITKPSFALEKGNNQINLTSKDIDESCTIGGKFILRPVGYTVKIMVFRSMDDLSPMCPAHNYKFNYFNKSN